MSLRPHTRIGPVSPCSKCNWSSPRPAVLTLVLLGCGGVSGKSEPTGNATGPTGNRTAKTSRIDSSPHPKRTGKDASTHPVKHDGGTVSQRDHSHEVHRASLSLGAPHDGSLQAGASLPTGAQGIHSNPRRPNKSAHFATAKVIQALVHAGQHFHQRFPRQRTTINDLSLPQGGPIAHHGSHESGRDVDILFSLNTPDGAPRISKGIPIDPKGTGTDYKDLTQPSDDVDVMIDLARTWTFIEGLLEQSHAPVQRIFIVEHLRTMLMDHAREHHAANHLIDRFGEVTCQPSHPHDDHYHVRFFCSEQDVRAGCEDTYPIFPWRRAQLRKVHLKPNRARPIRRAKKTKKSTPPPPMHASVAEYLKRRETWATKPHPGRPYCR